MAGRNFIQRVLHYVVNEFLVERLANNHSFQRFAVKSSKTIEELSQKGLQKREELSEQLKKFSKSWKSEVEVAYTSLPALRCSLSPRHATNCILHDKVHW